MFIRNSLAYALCIYFLCIKFGDSSVQGVQDPDRLNGTEGQSCFMGKTQQEGICKVWHECETPCGVKYSPCNGVKDILCCPIAKNQSISATKCEEYKEYACNISTSGNMPGVQRKTRVSNCATNAKGAVLGGEESQQREFPHMALIGLVNGSEKKFICGGTLISDRFVLSAAHCFHKKNSEIVVRLGQHYRRVTNEASRIDLHVGNLTLHPNYDIKYEYDDIALINLTDKVQFNFAIRPACLPQESITYNTSATATGWGLVTASEQSTVLMKVSLNVSDHNKCKRSFPIIHYRPQWIRKDSQFCAGSLTNNSNTCSGDSGGPLQIMHKRHHCTYTIIGVTLMGQDCSEFTTNSIGLYTNVFHYLHWIESIVWPGL